MTKDTLAASQRQFGGLSRIQLQAACVKLGFDSTGENEALRRMLENHWNKQHSRIESNQDYSMEVSSSDSVSFSKTALAMSEEVSMDNLSVAVEPEDKAAIKAEDEGDDNRVADSDEISVKLEVTDASTTPPKTEEQDLVKTEDLEGEGEGQKQAVDTSKMEVEGDLEYLHQQQHRHQPEMVEVKMEKETLVKEEDCDVLMEPKQEDVDDMEIDAKKEPAEQEGPSRPVATRTKLWEAKSLMTTSSTIATSRSALPVSSAKLNKLLNRSANPREHKTEEKGEADFLPAVGTVRSLVGRFAPGSTSSKPPESPSGKQKSGTTSTSASTPTLSKSSPKPRAVVPMIPRYKKVIKVPVASASTASKSPYAMQPSGSSSGTNALASLVGSKRKAGSYDSSVIEDSASSAVPAQKRKMVSVATINRLATPKKAKVSPPPPGLGSATGPSGSSTTITPPSLNNSSSSTTTAPPITPTRPTRARGPVLSTASRAAQRQSRQRP